MTATPPPHLALHIITSKHNKCECILMIGKPVQLPVLVQQSSTDRAISTPMDS